MTFDADAVLEQAAVPARGFSRTRPPVAAVPVVAVAARDAVNASCPFAAVPAVAVPVFV
jgi:hypothetical protein